MDIGNPFGEGGIIAMIPPEGRGITADALAEVITTDADIPTVLTNLKESIDKLIVR